MSEPILYVCVCFAIEIMLNFDGDPNADLNCEQVLKPETIKQECIPVGCVPHACCPYLLACTAPVGGWVGGGVPGPGGVSGPEGCNWSRGGVPGPGGCTWCQGVYLFLGVYLMSGVYQVPGGCTWSWGCTCPGTPPPPTVNRILDTRL